MVVLLFAGSTFYREFIAPSVALLLPSKINTSLVKSTAVERARRHEVIIVV